MARSDDPKTLIVQQNGRKVFIQTIAATTTAGRTNIAATAADGTAVPPDALLCVQGDGDFYYRPVAAGATAGTTATNSVRVTQYSQEFVHLRTQISGASGNVAADGALDLLAASGTVNVQVFLVT